MANNTIFKGSIVAIVTPFNEDLSINYSKLEELLNWHVSEGTDGIVILGTTGEASTLSKDEKLEVFRKTVEVINGRIPVIAGTGSNNTMETVSFSREVEALGVDGLLIVTPYYNKANDKGFITHYNMVADAVSLPIIVYNVPSRTACSLPVHVVKEISKHERIVAIKEASSDLSYVAKVASVVDKDFLIFSGNDDLVLPVLALGGTGVISVAANVIPKVFHQMVEDFHNGDVSKAIETQVHYIEYINNLFLETNPIPVKEYLNQMGKEVGGYRLPLCEPSDGVKEIITETLRKYS